MLEDRLRVILGEFERVPDPQELEDLYRSYYKENIPEEALKIIALLRDDKFREDLEGRIEVVESPITFEQKKAVYELYTKKRVIVPYGTGTGKTHIGIAMSYLLRQEHPNLKTVIIGPKANNLKQQWASRIRKYSIDPENEKIVIINNEEEKNGDKTPVIWDPEKEESLKLLEEADFIIINYHMVPKWKGYLPKKAYGIIDEAHNLIHENRVRASSIKELVKDYEHLAFLTATPMPNDIGDVEYHVRIVSKNDEFKIPKAIKRMTQVVRNHLKPYFVLPIASIDDNLFTSDGRKIKKTDYFIPITLSKEHYTVYKKIFEALNDKNLEEIKEVVGLTALREAAFDPDILFLERNSDPENGRELTSFINTVFQERPTLENKIYEALVRLVKEKYSRGEKTVIYTEFVTGVIDKVKGLLENEGIPTLVYDRENMASIQRLFQIEPSIGVVIGSPRSITEGASYTSANNAIFLCNSYEYYRIIQGSGRLMRPGQQNENVNIYHFYGKDTVNEGILKQTLTKGSGIVKVLNGVYIPDDQLDEVLNRSITSSKTIRSYLHPLNKKELTRTLIGLLINNEVQNLEEILNSKIDVSKDISGAIGEIFSNYYNEDFETSYHANVARAYSKMLGDLRLGKILDAAGGAATASRILKKPTTVVDINPYQLDAGKVACAELGIKNDYIKQALQDINFEEEYHTVIYSLGLGWARREDRVKILKNINKSLKKDGLLILTLPKSNIDENIRNSIEEGVGKLGFEVVKEHTGNVISEQDKDFHAYILAARKKEYVDEKISSEYFNLKKAEKIKGKTRSKEGIEEVLNKGINVLYSKQKKGGKELYEFMFDDGRELGIKNMERTNFFDNLKRIPSGEVKKVGRNLVKRYDKETLYRVCEKLLENVEDLSEKDNETYKKVEKLFDYLSKRMFGENGKEKGY